VNTDRPSFFVRRLYDCVYGSCFVFYTFGFSYRCRGWKNVPRTGPCLILCNHYSMLDPFAAALAVRRYVCQLARKNLFEQPVIGWFMRTLPGIPIDRSMGKDGIQAVLNALDRGNAVIMFPEGERSHTGEVQPLKPGVSLLIRRVKCPIVPVGVAGTFAAWSRFMKRPKFAPPFLPPGPGTIGVSVGEPINPARYESMGRDEMLADLRAALVREHAEADRIRRK
jgi:1-acyl-sn-glycerol-3-phosphate acyltransferase